MASLNSKLFDADDFIPASETKKEEIILIQTHSNEEYYFSSGDDEDNPDYYFFDYDEDTKKIDVQGTRNNTQGNSEKISNFQPSDKLFKKFTNKINVEKYEGPQNIPHHAANRLTEASRKQQANSHRSKDKQDRWESEMI